MEGDYVVVSKGFFFPTDYYIPTSAINTADSEGVYLNVTKDEALNQGWDTIPATTDSSWQDRPRADAVLPVDDPIPGSTATDYDANSWKDRPRADAVLPVDDPVPGSTGTDYSATTDVNDTDTLRVGLAEEELTAQTRPVERGAVHVDKVVTEEQQELDVPVTEERVNVSRRVVDRDLTPGETTFEEGTIDIPVRGEEVEVETRARVREEIDIDKEAVTGTERVAGTVRREEARITDDTGEVVNEANRPVR